MPATTSHAQQSVAPSSIPPPDFSDTEPSEDWKRQIKERIQLNLEKLYQEAEVNYRKALQDVRSDEERTRLKEDHTLKKGSIRTLGAEEYHRQLELERQQRKWALGLSIDESWKETLVRE
ncbi:hypothetical protein AMATHDRAFT_150935, partial [Amanita thiersii Skay4041]